MLNRLFPPNMGLWNGVGGKLEPGESPEACVLREVLEETGISLPRVDFKGIVTWTIDGVQKGGMYAFMAELPDSVCYETPKKSDEGLLEWKEISWLLAPENTGVTPNLSYFLPAMIRKTECYEHHCVFEAGRLADLHSRLYYEKELANPIK